MPKNKRSMTPNEKIIASALSSFQYTAHFWADDDMDAGRQNELLSPKKGESKKATHGELGYLKTRISEEFISEMNRLKKSNLEPLDLIDKIEKLVRRCEKLSENIRTYQEYYYVPSRNDYVHGYDVEEIPSSSGHRNAVSHDEGRLEKNFSAVRKKLDQVKVNYRQDLLVQDIHLQMEKIKKDGGFKNNKWNDATSRYPQKYAVLKDVLQYLSGNMDIRELSSVVHSNEKYDKGGVGRSETGKLLDRALELKGEVLKRHTARHGR